MTSRTLQTWPSQGAVISSQNIRCMLRKSGTGSHKHCFHQCFWTTPSGMQWSGLEHGMWHLPTLQPATPTPLPWSWRLDTSISMTLFPKSNKKHQKCSYFISTFKISCKCILLSSFVSRTLAGRLGNVIFSFAVSAVQKSTLEGRGNEC